MTPPRSTARALVVDDQRFDRHRLARLCSGLDRKMDVLNAGSLAAMAPLLEDNSFDLVLLDYSLPDGTGLDALDRVRICPRNCTAATIMIAGERREDIATKALAAGCADYIAKEDLTPDRFRAGITRALGPQGSTGAAARGSHDEIADALAAFSTECARDLKPQVSRVLRQLRDLRVTDDPVRQAKAHEGIERSCMRLWETLVELERYEAGDLDTTPQVASSPIARTSPSIFGR